MLENECDTRLLVLAEGVGKEGGSAQPYCEVKKERSWNVVRLRRIHWLDELA